MSDEFDPFIVTTSGAAQRIGFPDAGAIRIKSTHERAAELVHALVPDVDLGGPPRIVIVVSPLSRLAALGLVVPTDSELEEQRRAIVERYRVLGSVTHYDQEGKPQFGEIEGEAGDAWVHVFDFGASGPAVYGRRPLAPAVGAIDA